MIAANCASDNESIRTLNSNQSGGIIVVDHAADFALGVLKLASHASGIEKAVRIA